MNNADGKLQVVFLMDTKVPGAEFLERRHRAQCLACTRILLFLSKFPNREHSSNIQWSYKLFSSEVSTKSWRVDAAQFRETRSELLENFFGELFTSMKGLSNKSRERKQPWGRCVYDALAATVQDFVWDAPEIRTPVRPKSRKRGGRKPHGVHANITNSSSCRNIIFLFGETPRVEDGQSGANNKKGSAEDSSRSFVNQVLPSPLLSQLVSKNIHVYWVCAQLQRGIAINNDPTIECLSKALELTGGALLPIGIFFNPIPKRLPSLLLQSGQGQGGDEVAVNQDEGCSGPSEQNLSPPPAYLEDSMVEKKMKPHRDVVVSTSVLPPSVFFKEYLSGLKFASGGGGGDRLDEEKLFWLCSESGQVICIMELGRVCKSQPGEHTGLGFSSPSTLSKREQTIQVLGVVKSSDISLQLLEPSSVYSCSSLYVPAEVKAVNIPVRSYNSSMTPPPQSVLASITGGLKFHKSPQIHLFRSPVSHRKRKSRCKWRADQGHKSKLRRRSASVPDLNRRTGKGGKVRGSCRLKEFSIALAQEGVAKTSQRCSSSVSPVKRVVDRDLPSQAQDLPSQAQDLPLKSQDFSPQFHDPDHIQASDVRVDLCECLRETGRFHSRQYQNLCIWLASNRLLLLVKVVTSSEGPAHLALLQPVSSLISSLSFIKSCHYSKMEALVVQSVLSSPLGQSTGTVPCHLTGITSLDCEFPGKNGGGEENDVEAAMQPQQDESIPSHLELRSNIHLLLRCHSGSLAPVPSSSGAGGKFGDPRRAPHLLGSNTPEELHPFTYAPLLSWFPYAQTDGVKGQTIEQIREMQMDMKESECDGLSRRKELLSRLREAYSGSSHQMDGTEHEADTSGLLEAEKDEGEKNEAGSEGRREELPVLSEEELFERFKVTYEEQLSDSVCSPNSTMEMEVLYQWVSKALPNLLQQVAAAGPASGSLLQFWNLLNSDILLSSRQLGEKYSNVEDSPNNLKREINEYLFQVLLHLESWKLCQEEVVEDDAVLTLAHKLIALLRRVSLLGNPRLLGNFMEKLATPMYVSSCKELLMEVYEGLMLPLPPDIEGSPASSLRVEGEEGESSEEEMGLLSWEEPLAPRVAKPSARKLVRHKSFQEVSTRRVIAVPRNKQKKKKRHREMKKENNANNLLAAEKIPLKLRRSPRVAKLTSGTGGKNRRKSVCRSLFSRSHTVSEISVKGKGIGHADLGKKSRRSSETFHQHVLVKETPVKLQRLKVRSLVSESPGIKIIQESPRRSFYSVAKRQVLTPQFKTPPYHHHIKSSGTPGSVPLNNDPSSASAIHSLLHDSFTSSPCKNSKTDTPTTTTSSNHLIPSTLALATGISPDLCDKSDSPSDILSSKDLFKSYDPPRPDIHGKGSRLSGAAKLKWNSGRHPGPRPARMLTYEGEDPLIRSPDKLKSTSVDAMMAAKLPCKSVRTLLRPCRTANTVRTPIKSNRTPSRPPIKSKKIPTKLNWSSIRTLATRTPTEFNQQSPIRTLIGSTKTPIKLSRSPITKSTRTPTKFTRTPNKYIRTPTKYTRTPTKCKGKGNNIQAAAKSAACSDRDDADVSGFALFPSTSTPTKIPDEVSLVSPPSSTDGYQDDIYQDSIALGSTSRQSQICLLSNLEQDSASMVAFSMSTPTKEEPRDFHHAFYQS